MKRVALLAAFLVAACGSFGVAQPHTISLAYKAGDAYKYRFHATSKQIANMTGMSVPIQLDTSANETVTVKSVDSSGTADLTITLSDLTLKSVTGGITNTTTGIPSSSVDVKIKSDGTIVSIDGNSTAAGSPLAAFSGIGGGFFIAAVLPDKAVKVGDSWSKTYDQSDPKGFGTVHITSTSKYLRDETLNNVTTAVVETKSDGKLDFTGATGNTTSPVGGFSMHGTFTTDVTTWIDASGHRIVKSHGTAHDDVTLNFPTMSPPTTDKTTPTTPFMQGPITATGDSTSDLTPA